VVKPKQAKSRNADPHRRREAKKYSNPIPSREFILDTLAETGVPLTFDEIAATFDIRDAEEVIALQRRLGAMVRDGQLVLNRRDAYCLVNKQDLIAGRVIGHPDGFGFVKPDDGGDDVYLYSRQMRGLFHNDRVVVRVIGRDRRGRLEGSVVEVLERNTRTVVGRFYQESGVGFVVPDNKRLVHHIIIPSDRIAGSEQNRIVVAEITDQPTKRTQPIGKILEVVGDHRAPGMETDIAIRTHDLPVQWPAAVETELAGLETEVPASARDGRVDLRRLPLVTIDGADARDFDDAVYCEPKPKGWKLLVCIADVSGYVEPGTALDAEAHQRGNSVYFPGRVIPMLPEVLSNGLCSLNPDVERLCMACELYVDRTGKVARSRFFPAVMRSHARFTYDQVAALLGDDDPRLRRRFSELLPHLHALYAHYQALHGARTERGAIDFDTTETSFALDEQGCVLAIRPLVRNVAHRIIEECMLAANVAAARLFQRKRIPALYRIHETPKDEKLSDLREFLAELSLRLPGGKRPTAKDYAALLDAVRARPDRHLIQTVLLRSMQQAMYSSENAGHFGLAYPTYTHFTSPIRRYPDLIVHRAIKHLLAGGPRRISTMPSRACSASANTAPAPSAGPTRLPVTSSPGSSANIWKTRSARNSRAPSPASTPSASSWSSTKSTWTAWCTSRPWTMISTTSTRSGTGSRENAPALSTASATGCESGWRRSTWTNVRSISSWRRASSAAPKSASTKLELMTMETTNHANSANQSERILWK